jgi:WhiB family redox-sensing transcriptional regulator
MSELPFFPTEDAEQSWMLRGACRGKDPGFFFPSDGVGVELARQVCADCPVRVECLEYALHFRIEHGVWGGASERERRRILRQRRAAGLTGPR